MAYTLDDIRSAADKKYGSTDFELDGITVRLLNPLRLRKEKRDQLEALQTQMHEDDADSEALLADIIRLVAQTTQQADALLDALGGDLAQLVSVFSLYTDGTELGEASASAS